VDEVEGAATLNFCHQPLARKTSEVVEEVKTEEVKTEVAAVVRTEAVAVDLDGAVVGQRKWRFSREKLRHVFLDPTKD
jgi:hypothetical protein